MEERITRRIYIAIGLVLCFTAIIMYKIQNTIILDASGVPKDFVEGYGDESHDDTEPAEVVVTIKKAESSVNLTYSNHTYTGQDIDLITEYADLIGEEIKFSLDGNVWETTSPKKKNVGEYKVVATLIDNENYQIKSISNSNKNYFFIIICKIIPIMQFI